MTGTLPQLRAFVAVVDTGNFNDAASVLEMTQPAISHAIAGLERAVGDRLVQRKPTVVPTPLGQRLLPHARAALASVDAIAQEVAAFHGQRGGTVRLAATPTVCQGLLPDLICFWQEQSPRIEIQVFEGDDEELPVWLEDGLVDAAILVDADPAPDGGALVLRDPFLAVMRRDHVLASEPRIHLRDLLDDPFINSYGGCETQVRMLFAMAGEPYRPAQHVRETGTLIRMVASDLGVTAMPAISAAMLPPEVVMIPLDPHLERTLTFAGPSSRPWNPLVETLRDLTHAWIADASPPLATEAGPRGPFPRRATPGSR